MGHILTHSHARRNTLGYERYGAQEGAWGGASPGVLDLDSLPNQFVAGVSGSTFVTGTSHLTLL